MNTKTQPVASEPSSLNELAEVWSKAMTEYRELLARAGADAEKFRVENDMFGWNFHKGLKSGAIEMRLILCKVEKAIAALLSSDAKPASEPVAVPQGYPCEIEEADFEANTINVKMLTNDYRIHAGEYRLSAAPSPAPVGIKKEND